MCPNDSAITTNRGPFRPRSAHFSGEKAFSDLLSSAFQGCFDHPHYIGELIQAQALQSL